MRTGSLLLVGTTGWLAVHTGCSFRPRQQQHHHQIQGLIGASGRRRCTVASNTVLFVGRPPSDQPFSHTYVEGATFDDRTAEIEAMGGDPFFLSDDDEGDTIQQVETTEDALKNDESNTLGMSELLASMAMMSEPNLVSRFGTDGQGPSPKKKDNIMNVMPTTDKWEWDGTVDDDAHLDLD